MSCSPLVTDAAWATETVGRVSKKLAGRLTTHVDNFNSFLSVNRLGQRAFAALALIVLKREGILSALSRNSEVAITGSAKDLSEHR